MGKLSILFWILFWSMSAFSMNAFGLQETEYDGMPAPVDNIVYVRPFALSQGYRWFSVNDEPKADKGVIVVLRVDPKLVIPSNGLSPILYAGDRMLQALNFGHTSGHVIGLIPGEVDLSQTPIWFGPPTAPGRITQQSIKAERAAAEKAGIRPFSAKRIETVTQPAIIVPDLRSLLREALAELVLEYAPQERGLARKWRLPEAKAEPDLSQPGAVKPQP